MARGRKREVGSIGEMPDRIRRDVEDANDENGVSVDTIENAVLAIALAAQVQANSFVDLSRPCVLAQEVKRVRQSGKISVTCNRPVDRGSVSKNIKQIGVGGSA